MLLDVPTSVWVPVVVKVAVSPFTRPVMLPAAVRGFPSYTLLASGVTTVTVAGVIVILPSTYVMFSFDVTSVPAAFLIISLSQFASTVPSSTWVAVSLDAAVSKV